MRLSQLFSKTTREDPADEVSVNAKLLIRAGFVEKVGAGIYSFLPLGLRVVEKISAIVREEMNTIFGQEVLMPVLHPKEYWQKTGRWDEFDVLFKVKGKAGDFAVGPTHEEIVVPMAKRFISTYRDLPKAVFQIQTKFRDEPRAKSGLLRGREFLMKDLYSFHTDEADLDRYYEIVKAAYLKVFKRVGLEAMVTEASGGTFSKFSHEFQVLCQTGEDKIHYCQKGHFSRNDEIIDDLKKCPECGEQLSQSKASEVGNIFKLKTKYSDPFELKFTDKDGKQKPVVMGCYGIGISRLLATIVEIFNDQAGIIWPATVAPYRVHLIVLDQDSNDVFIQAEKVYEKLQQERIEVLFDDRADVTAGEKFADSDLIGIPVRLVVSEKTGKDKVEWKQRDKDKIEVLKIEQILARLKR